LDTAALYDGQPEFTWRGLPGEFGVADSHNFAMIPR